MIGIKSCEELSRLLADFTFEDIGFEIVGQGEHFIEYYKKRRHRADLYVRVNKKNFETEVYTWDKEKQQSDTRKGIFNIRRQDELLFLLTHCLNELKVDPYVLDTYKRQIEYDPADVIPNRLTKQY